MMNLNKRNQSHIEVNLNPFYQKDIISIKDFDRSDLDHLFSVTNGFARSRNKRVGEILQGKILGMMFFEPSTRTRLSFEAAMASLGGISLGFADPNVSATEKGENLSDTVRTMEQYADALILRHPMEGAARLAAEISEIPVINGGSGSEEHPTQAMLDLYTILREKKRIDNLRIAVVGDLKYGRTIYSLLYALSKYSPRIHLVSPPPLRIRSEAMLEVGSMMKVSEHESLDEVISDLDVIYVTRIQKERFPDLQEYEKVRGSYRVNKKILESGKEGLIIMHPFPRADEIPREVDSTDYQKYFLQIKYGKLIRSVLLGLVLVKNFKIRNS